MNDLRKRLASLTSERRSYVQQTLVAHLEDAGRITDIHTLLALETTEHRNAWYDATDAFNDTENYVADVTRAWRITEKAYANASSTRSDQFKDNEKSSFSRIFQLVHFPTKFKGWSSSQPKGQSFGLQYRYGLIIASVNSIATQVPLDLLLALVRSGSWHPAQALAHVRRIDLLERGKVLRALIPYLPASLLKEALEDVLQMTTEQQSTLEILVPCLPISLLRGVVRDIEIRAPEYTISVLIAVANKLSETERTSIVREILKKVQVIEYSRPFDNISQMEKLLETLAASLSNWGYLDMALEAARAVTDLSIRVRVLLSLAPYLSEPTKGNILYEALETFRAIQTDEKEKREGSLSQGESLLYLVSSMITCGHFELGLEATRTINTSSYTKNVYRIDALLELIPHLSEPMKEDVLRELYREWTMYWRDYSVLEYYHPESVLEDWEEKLASVLIKMGYAQEVLDVAQNIYNSYRRPIHPSGVDKWKRAILATVSHLPEAMKDKMLLETLARARKLTLKWEQAEILTRLVPHLLEPLREQVLWEVLEIVRRDSGSVEFLNEIITSAAKNGYLSQVLEIILEPEFGFGQESIKETARDRKRKDQKLADLSRRLLEMGYPQESLKVVQAIRDSDLRCKQVLELFPKLPEPLKISRSSTALNMIKTTYKSEPAKLWESLTIVAPFLPDTSRDKELHVILAAAQMNDLSASSKLASLVQDLGKVDHISEAIEVARKIRSIQLRRNVLLSFVQDPLLVNAIGKSMFQEILREVLSLTPILDDRRLQEEAMVELTHKLGELGGVQEALRTVQTIKDNYYQAKATAQLISSLNEPLKHQVINQITNTVKTFPDVIQRAEVIVLLLPHLSQPLKITLSTEALDALQEEQYACELGPLMVKLALHLPEPLKEEKIHEIVDLVESFEDMRFPLYYNREEKSEKEVIEELDWENEKERLARLAKLIPSLTGALQHKKLNLAQWILEEHSASDYKASTLKDLAPYLSESLLRKTVNVIKKAEDDYDRANLLAAVLPRLAEIGYPQEALDEAYHIEYRTVRAEALAALAPYLPENMFHSTLETTLNFAPLTPNRLEGLETLISSIIQRSSTDVLSHWIDIFHVLSTRTRKELLETTHVLIPIFVMQGGKEAVIEVLRAIQDTGRWWP